MKEVKFLLVVTKDGNRTFLSFRKDESNALKYKYDYFISHGYLVEAYISNFREGDILLTSFSL